MRISVIELFGAMRMFEERQMLAHQEELEATRAEVNNFKRELIERIAKAKESVAASVGPMAISDVVELLNSLDPRPTPATPEATTYQQRYPSMFKGGPVGGQ